MNSKIVGFTISPQKVDFKFDLNTNLKVEYIAFETGFLSIYYFGELQNCKVKKNQFSMGFPVSDNLLDNNLLITYTDSEITIENDWMGSIPVFYNTREKIISNFSMACNPKNQGWDEEGLYLYLKYGFSIFEKTPFQNIKFLRFYCTLKLSEKGINIHEKEDPILKIDQFKGASENDIWNDFEKNINNKEEKVKGSLVIPTSGGLDSRLLNCFIKDKSRIKAYSYGISTNQSNSFEVKIAKEITSKLGVYWKQIELNDAYDYYEKWHDIFGFSTHLHGMIHMEMYDKIKTDIQDDNATVVSGIYGDPFTGSLNFSLNKDVEDIYKLALTHGLNYKFKNYSNNSNEALFAEKNKDVLSDLRLYPVISMRIKIILLNYLITVPGVMNMPAWTPFFNFEMVMKMLNLPMERRKDRLWVRELLEQKNLNPKKSVFFQDTKNRLNYNLHLKSKYDPINKDFDIPFIDKDSINNINDVLSDISLSTKLNYKLTTNRFIKEVFKKIGVTNSFNQNLVNYQLIKALELSMK